MTAYVGASIQFQTHSVTDLLPDASRCYRVPEKSVRPVFASGWKLRMRQIRDRPGSAKNQRTTSGIEAMFLSVTVQLCASSSGAPMRSRISRAKSVNASRTG